MFHGYAAQAPGQQLQPYDFEPTPLGPNDVEIAVTHCGICHTDIHLVNNDWWLSAYPLIPGHEVVGEVTAAGSAVKSLKPGVRVGVGWLSATCAQCEQCRDGHENNCAGWQPTCLGRPGGFADRICVDHRWAFELPKGLASDEAGPLMCGGATMHTRLHDHEVKDGLLRPRGTLCLVGVPASAVQFQAFPLIGGHKAIVGSNTGSRAGIKAMLETAAKKGVKPLIERHSLSDVNDAMARVARNQVRYRAVLVS